MEITLKGLCKWYDQMFEKFGHVIVAREQGNQEKYVEFKKHLAKLATAIKEKLPSVNYIDKKNDLMIMHKNVMTLLGHMDKEFQQGGRRESKRGSRRRSQR